MRNFLLLASLFLLTPHSSAAGAAAAVSPWVPVLQGLAGPNAGLYQSLNMHEVSIPGLLSQLSRVDWNSPEGQRLAAPVLERLRGEEVRLGDRRDQLMALNALTSAAAHFRNEAASLLPDAERLLRGEGEAERLAADLVRLEGYSGFLTPTQNNDFARVAPLARARLDEFRRQRAAGTVAEGTKDWSRTDDLEVAALPSSAAQGLHLSPTTRRKLSRVSAWNFDLDDNALRLPTKIVLFDKKTGAEKPVSTKEFADLRDKLGELGLETRDDPATGSFRNFRDAMGGNNFLEDIKWAVENLPKSAWQGPSWKAFAFALSRPETAAWTTIITARGHSRENIIEGLKFLQERGYIKYLPPLENIYCVGDPKFKSSAANPSAAKAEIMKDILDRIEATALAPDAPYVVDQNGFRPVPLHLFGFSDDDWGNFETSYNALAAEFMKKSKEHPKGRWANVKITVFYTGPAGPGRVPGPYVITPDGSLRPSTKGERREAYVRRLDPSSVKAGNRRTKRSTVLPLKDSMEPPSWIGLDTEATTMDLEVPHLLQQDTFGDTFRAMDLAEATANFPSEVRTAAHQFLIAVTDFFEEEAAGTRQPGEFWWKVDEHGVRAMIRRGKPMGREGETGRLHAYLTSFVFPKSAPLMRQLLATGGRITLYDSGPGGKTTVWVEIPRKKRAPRKTGLEPLKAADGFRYLPLNIRSVNERDRKFLSARTRASDGLTGLEASLVAKFLDRAVRFAKEEARENGERVFVEWRSGGRGREIAVRREGDRPMAAFSKGTPMRAWHEGRWKASLKDEPGLYTLLGSLMGEVSADSAQQSADPNSRRLVLLIPR